MLDNYSMEAQPGRSGLSLFRTLLNNALDLVFPPHCTGCGKVDTRWCEHCADTLASVPIIPLERLIDTDLTVISSGLHQGKVRDAIHALKYDNLPEIGEQLSQRLYTVLKSKNWRIDTIIPVPLHTTRLQQRGYNQAQVLSEFLAQRLEIPCRPEAVTRQRETQSQVTLNRTERLNNMQEAFVANPRYVAGKNVLIIDDVLTTGATLLAVAHALKKSTSNTIYGLTITTASE